MEPQFLVRRDKDCFWTYDIVIEQYLHHIGAPAFSVYSTLNYYSHHETHVTDILLEVIRITGIERRDVINAFWELRAWGLISWRELDGKRMFEIETPPDTPFRSEISRKVVRANTTEYANVRS